MLSLCSSLRGESVRRVCSSKGAARLCLISQARHQDSSKIKIAGNMSELFPEAQHSADSFRIPSQILRNFHRSSSRLSGRESLRNSTGFWHQESESRSPARTENWESDYKRPPQRSFSLADRVSLHGSVYALPVTGAEAGQRIHQFSGVSLEQQGLVQDGLSTYRRMSTAAGQGDKGEGSDPGRRLRGCREPTAAQGVLRMPRRLSTVTGEGKGESTPSAGATMTVQAMHGESQEMDGADVAQGADVAVDVSGLKRSGHVHTRGEEEGLSPMEKQLLSLIRFRGGPISVAEFMEQVLTNPVAGYYMQPSVFGTQGDFVTSPDISQMFGEMIGVWVMCVWEQLGRPARLQLVELGPGRGALMADLLRSTWKFDDFRRAVSEVALVEVSPALRSAQRAALASAASRIQGAGAAQKESAAGDRKGGEAGAAQSDGKSHQLVEGTEPFEFSGVPVKWFSTFDEVPQGEPFVVIAHEFFDALPIHQFQKTERGWCEKLVDVHEKPLAASGKVTGEPQVGFRFVLSPGPTSATTLALLPRLKWASKHTPGASTDTSGTPDPAAGTPGASAGTPGASAGTSSAPGETGGATGAPGGIGGNSGTPRGTGGASPSPPSGLQQVEVSPASVRVALDIAQRIAKDSGAALVVDYGGEGDEVVSDSLQAIRRHQFVPVLDRPGSADLSAHVDFAALRHAVNTSGLEAQSFGPITQSSFLGQLGINFRVEALMESATEEQAESLRLAYWRLVGDGEPPWEAEEEEDGAGKRAGERTDERAGEWAAERATEGAEHGDGGLAGGREGGGGEGAGSPSSPSVTGMGSQYKVLAIVKKGLGPPVCFS